MNWTSTFFKLQEFVVPSFGNNSISIGNSRKNWSQSVELLKSLVHLTIWSNRRCSIADYCTNLHLCELQKLLRSTFKVIILTYEFIYTDRSGTTSNDICWWTTNFIIFSKRPHTDMYIQQNMSYICTLIFVTTHA